jgi:lipoprotein-anchoring transpeptidase ErfK/SrfK
MGFGATIRKLQGLCALILLSAVPGGVSAQQTGQVALVPAPPQPALQIAPANPPLVIADTEIPSTPPPVTTPPVVTPPAVKPTVTPPPKPRKKGPGDALKPGQFIWIKQGKYEGPLKIVIVLDIQRIYVFQNDKLIGFSTISTGKKGKETPIGAFNILQKNVDHKSNLYSNAPMPYMQRLTWDGIAIHGGDVPGYPASHGCIRLPHPFAKALYGLTQMNQEVVVLQDTSTPVKRPAPKPVVDPTAAPADPGTTSAATPSNAPPKPAEPFPPEPSI